MQKWEYSLLGRVQQEAFSGEEIFFIGPDGTKKNYNAKKEGLLLRALNKLGAEGWEVVGYAVNRGNDEIWTLKRPKQ